MKQLSQMLFFLLAHYSMSISAQDSTLGKIIGTVTGLDNKYVANATLKLYDAKDEYLSSTLTNDSGFFRFNNLSETTKYAIKFIYPNGRELTETGIHVVNGKFTELNIKVGIPCDFYYGNSRPSCKRCGNDHKVIEIKYQACYGKVKPYIKRNQYFKCYEKERCYCCSHWYCKRCKIEL